MSNQKQDSELIAIDVGGGTQDILIYSSGQPIENCPKLVMPSPTHVIAGMIARATAERRAIFLHGEIMGGGSCTKAVKEHIAAGLAVSATPRAALTFHDNVERVEQMGIAIADTSLPGAVSIRLGDVDTEAIGDAVSRFGVRLPDRWAVAVQDHGYSPHGSNREARFAWFRTFIDSGGELGKLAFREVPALFTRMQAVQKIVPGALLMDTGPAAILGALLDDDVGPHVDEGLLVVNAGNCHTMCALVRGSRMVGLLEHHTAVLNPHRLDKMLDRFRAGKLPNEEILAEGGHGCYVDRDAIGKDAFRFVSATGPNRDMLEHAHMAVPHGDMMLTGCFGLIDAARKAGIIKN
jgi:uncharacterized protein (DUF1786 family)